MIPQRHVTIATIWGIPIGIHVSWLIVFGLVTWSLAASYFPAQYPGWSRPISWLVAALASGFFFVSILTHELAHSWVALRSGVPIRGITLFVFGGVAQTAREAVSPAADLRIAIAGPLMSVVLSAVFGGIAAFTRGVEQVAAICLWLSRVNVMVAVFNLIPGYPLDGGRVFRAAVWWWTSDRNRAMRLASFTGQLVAYGFIAVGILAALRGNVLSGVWITLIGWFLHGAAGVGGAEATLRELLRSVTVRQAMTRDCARVAGDLTLERLIHDEVLEAGRRCFVVVDDGHLRGLVTLHAIKRVPRERWPRTRVEEIMTPAKELTTVRPEDDLLDALQKMDDTDVAQLPVMSGDTLLGMLSREHVLHYLRTRTELGV